MDDIMLAQLGELLRLTRSAIESTSIKNNVWKAVVSFMRDSGDNCRPRHDPVQVTCEGVGSTLPAAVDDAFKKLQAMTGFRFDAILASVLESTKAT